MPISQGKIIESLSSVINEIDRGEFIYQFLLAFGIAKSAITRLRNDGQRNVGLNGDVGLKKQLYFRVVNKGVNVYQAAESLKTESVVAANDIRFVMVTDFDSVVAFDLKADESLDTDIHLLDKQYAFFLPLAGFEKAIMYSDHPADIKASEKMGQLFDLIRERNDLSKPEDIHALNVFLTRLLFCFYAEDTGIFEKDQMTKAIESTTSINGEGLDQFFIDLFLALNLPSDSDVKRAMPAHFQAFPYVNGGLFKADEPVPAFSTKSRRILLECGGLSWSEINPDIFGSMFQAVIDPEQRGSLGQHYTSVANIMKVIKPLFLDELWEALDKAKGKEKKLKELLIRLQNLRIFDPACGSGNFLIIAYKELRKLEMAVIDELNSDAAQSEIYYSGIRLSQFYGIEIDDFAHEIAVLSLWLSEHQMNLMFMDKFGYASPSLPLSVSANIFKLNALDGDWKNTLSPEKNIEIFICGNPPFIGDRFRSNEQSKELSEVLKPIKNSGRVDYVAAWFVKAVRYMALSPENIFTAFVSTNSLFQGVQVSTLWRYLIDEGVSIDFAHQSFAWKNNAKLNAGVHVVIVGFSLVGVSKKRIYNNNSFKVVKNISPYLLEGGDVVVSDCSVSLSKAKRMVMGNYTNDGGYLIFSEYVKNTLVDKDPLIQKWIKEIVGADEFIKGKHRYCLWLAEASQEDISAIPEIYNRVEGVRIKRLSSTDKSSQAQAKTPHLFREQHAPKKYIFIPQVSSSRRKYIPIDILGAEKIPIAPNFFIDNGDLYDFGILNSEMHNDWMRRVAGRLKSDYRYSPKLVYNTYPWPEVNQEKKLVIESLAEEVLLIREDYPDKTLADLYDPDKMPLPLLEAHRMLDQAVEKLYRTKPFGDATERLEHLFGLYEQLIANDKKGA